jgi:hypothetical protein
MKRKQTGLLLSIALAATFLCSCATQNDQRKDVAPVTATASRAGFASTSVEVSGRNKDNGGPIIILSKPEDRIAPTNGTALFAVVAEPGPGKSGDSLTFQWQKNGYNIAGATGPSLVLTNVNVSDVGFYNCMVGIQGTGIKRLVNSGDDDAPGARLFVYIGTNTAVAGPYQPGTGSKSCVGAYVGKVTMIDPVSKRTWFSRPTSKTNCKIVDITSTLGLPTSPAYSSKVSFVDSFDLASNCGTTALGPFAVAAPPTHQYQFTIWVTSGNLPLGTPITMDIQWGP